MLRSVIGLDHSSAVSDYPYFRRDLAVGCIAALMRTEENGRLAGRFLGAIILAHHPRPDVRGTMAKGNTSSSLVLSQETDGVTIGEDQIRKVQDKGAASRLVVD